MLELTTSGIERVYGPLHQEEGAALHGLQLQSQYEQQEQEEPSTQAKGLIPIAESEQYNKLYRQLESTKQSKVNATIDDEIAALETEIAELKRLALLKEKVQLQQKLLLNEEAEKPAVNRIADSTSEVLQKTSSSSIQFIAKLFSDVIN